MLFPLLIFPITYCNKIPFPYTTLSIACTCMGHIFPRRCSTFKCVGDNVVSEDVSLYVWSSQTHAKELTHVPFDEVEGGAGFVCGGEKLLYYTHALGGYSCMVTGREGGKVRGEGRNFWMYE